MKKTLLSILLMFVFMLPFAGVTSAQASIPSVQLTTGPANLGDYVDDYVGYQCDDSPTAADGVAMKLCVYEEVETINCAYGSHIYRLHENCSASSQHYTDMVTTIYGKMRAYCYYHLSGVEVSCDDLQLDFGGHANGTTVGINDNSYVVCDNFSTPQYYYPCPSAGTHYDTGWYIIGSAGYTSSDNEYHCFGSKFYAIAGAVFSMGRYGDYAGSVYITPAGTQLCVDSR